MTNLIKPGAHLGVIRRWVKRTFTNGCEVTWGSTSDILQKPSGFTPYDLDFLACEIRQAVLQELNVKDIDHVYKYKIICLGEGTFLQYVDTSKEAWTALFELKGHVYIYYNAEHTKLSYSACIFSGDATKALNWVKENRLEDM